MLTVIHFATVDSAISNAGDEKVDARCDGGYPLAVRMNALDEATVDGLWSSTLVPERISRVSELVRRGRGDDIVSRLLATAGAGAGERRADVRRTMGLLESMVDRESTGALYLMAHLYSRASEVFLHDVCDAIELRLHEACAQELSGLLSKSAREEADSEMRRRYENWAEAVRP